MCPKRRQHVVHQRIDNRAAGVIRLHNERDGDGGYPGMGRLPEGSNLTSPEVTCGCSQINSLNGAP